MSHNTHVFLIDNCLDLGDAALTMENNLITNPPDLCDYFTVLGVINLNTGEYKDWNKKPYITNKIRSKNDLEEFANRLYSKERWDRLQADLERFIKSELFWNAKCACEELDGINYAKSLGFPKWSADPDKAFAINDGYCHLSGISDWKTIEDQSEADYEQKEVYAVIVDFHS